MTDLLKYLGDIGLNHFESKIYLALLESGELPASKIALKTKTPRSTTRSVLDRLCLKGIVTKIYKRNTQYYQSKPPEALGSFLDQNIQQLTLQKQDLHSLLPTFNKLYQQHHTVPKVQFFEGAHQVIEAFNRSLYEDVEEILIFTSYDFLKTPIIQKNDDEFFMKQRIKRNISARVLVGNTKDSEAMPCKSPSELRERRFIPKGYDLPGNIHIYGHSVMYFSASNNEYMAVLTESQMMTDTMRNVFRFMWDTCE